MKAMTAATTRKTTVRTSWRGGPEVLQLAEVQELAAGAVDLDREDPHDDDQRAERDRGERPEVRAALAAQEAEADAEEAPEQDEVGEVREVDDVRAGPADQRQLHEEHQEAQQNQARAVTQHGARHSRGTLPGRFESRARAAGTRGCWFSRSDGTGSTLPDPSGSNPEESGRLGPLVIDARTRRATSWKMSGRCATTVASGGSGGSSAT